MIAVHVHLLLSHAPTLVILIGCGLLIIGAWLKSEDLKKAGLGVFVLGALVVLPLYLTGDPAQDAVKGLPAVSDRILDQHQAMAAIALVSALFLGVLAGAGFLLFGRAKPVAFWFICASVVVSLLTSGLLAWTANLGGQIRHSEIRPLTAPQN
jgi:hypothetical protein